MLLKLQFDQHNEEMFLMSVSAKLQNHKSSYKMQLIYEPSAAILSVIGEYSLVQYYKNN